MPKSNRYSEVIERLEVVEKQLKGICENNREEINRDLFRNQNKSKRFLARASLINILTEMYPGLYVTIATRESGGGITLTNKNNMSVHNIKFYYSKNYRENRLFAWFSIRETDICKYDFYALCVEYNNKNHTFLFSKKEMDELIKEKKNIRNSEKIDQAIEHLYIEEVNGKYLETREYDKNLNELRPIVDVGFDVTKHHNEYSIFEREIGEVKSNNKNAFIIKDRHLIRKKIIDVLDSEMLISLHKKDFSSGIPSRYIEIEGSSISYEIDKERLSNLKAVVIHVSSSEMMTLTQISKIINQIKELYQNSNFLIYGLTIGGTSEIRTEIFEIEYRR